MDSEDSLAYLLHRDIDGLGLHVLLAWRLMQDDMKPRRVVDLPHTSSTYGNAFNKLFDEN